MVLMPYNTNQDGTHQDNNHTTAAAANDNNHTPPQTADALQLSIVELQAISG